MNFYFFIVKLPNVLPVNTESIFKLSSGFPNTFLIATAANNCIYKVRSFAVEIWFQDKWLVPILKFKEFTLYNIIARKATFSSFCCFEKKFEEHKRLFKLHNCFFQSINLCLANILPKVLRFWGLHIFFLLSETRLNYFVISRYKW